MLSTKSVDQHVDESNMNKCLLADYPDLLTVSHVCEQTGLSEQTIRALINDGKLPGCRIGRRLYVPKTRFVEYVEQGGGLQ